MTLPLTEAELAETRRFLSEYVEQHREVTDDTVLIRPNCYCMTEEEMEGEIIDLVLTYLSRRKCGSALKSALAYHTAMEIKKADLEMFKQDHTAHLSDGDHKSYDAIKVAKAVFRKLFQLCTEWLVQMPVLCKNRISYLVSVDAIKNTRRKMEDKHVVLTDFSVLHGLDQVDPSQALFSVFDGHGGVDAACFASSQLHCNLKRFEKLGQQPLEALRYAYTKTDADFTAKAKRERLKSGCTGVTVLIQNHTLHVAWVGDSQVFLGKNGTAVKLMDPHCPEREDERLRIEELGGCVVWFGGWRVNGSLAVSRAIGDCEQKPFVCADADISEYILEGDEDYLILGCDGLWDTVTPATAIELLDAYLLGGEDKNESARMLVSQAKSRGSTDNISVVVVFLDEHKTELRSVLKNPDQDKLTEDLKDNLRI